MRWLLVTLSLASVGLSRADEASDQLAKELVGVVRDPRLSQRQRVEAARTLGKLGPKAAAVVPDLIAQLKRLQGAELEELQEAVIDTLGGIGATAKTALPTLAATAGRSLDIDQAAKRTTDAILAADDTRNVTVLVQQLASRDVGVRFRAVKALGALKGDATDALPALTVTLLDTDADVRRAAIAAVRLIQPDAKPSKELVQALAADLKDPDDGVRLLAVRSLGRLGSAAGAALPEVEKLLTDPDRDVRKAAAEAVLKMSVP